MSDHLLPTLFRGKAFRLTVCSTLFGHFYIMLVRLASAYGCTAAAAPPELMRPARGQATSDASLCSGFAHTLQARYCRVFQRGAHVSM